MAVSAEDEPADDDTTPIVEEAPDLVEDAPPVEPDGLPELSPEPVSGELDPVETAPVELTAEQREIKMLRDQLARERGRKDVVPEAEVLAKPGDTGNIVIHFLEDGLTVNGRVMFRGDELEFEVGSKAYRDTCNRYGKTFLDMRDDDFAQVEVWDKIMFRSGPWRGKSYADGKYEQMRVEGGNDFVKPPTEAEIEAAEKARLNRAAPRLPAQV